MKDERLDSAGKLWNMQLYYFLSDVKTINCV